MAEQKINFKAVAFFIKIGALLFVIGALFTPFATGLKITVESAGGDVVTTYKSAFSFFFGGKLVSEHVTYQTIGNSVTGLLGYIFMICSALLVATSIVLNKKVLNISRILLAVAVVLILVSAILMFASHRSAATVLSDAILGEHSDAVTNTIYRNTSLQFGFWGVGMFGIIAIVLLLASLIFDGTVDQIRNAITAKQ